MIVCGCTGATDRDVRCGNSIGRAAGTRCGGCISLVSGMRPPDCVVCGPPFAGIGGHVLGHPICHGCALRIPYEPDQGKFVMAVAGAELRGMPIRQAFREAVGKFPRQPEPEDGEEPGETSWENFDRFPDED